MSLGRLAYLPLITYPDFAPDDSVEAAVAMAATIGCELHATTFAADIPHVSSALGDLLINIPEMIRATEEKSREQCRILHGLVLEKAGAGIKAQCSNRALAPGAIADEATEEARYYDLVLLPWMKDSQTIRDLAQALVFGAGRPAILMPPGVREGSITHVAVAWDGSRVAARALADIMPLLTAGTRVTVLTVKDEKKLGGQGLAEALASSLQKRGLDARAENIRLGTRTIAEALQETAVEAGADLLVMGGFGHSRVRDFILGGATNGVFNDLRLPVLLSH